MAEPWFNGLMAMQVPKVWTISLAASVKSWCGCTIQSSLTGIPVSDDCIVHPHQDLTEAASEIVHTLGTCIAIKPLNQGSAIGVQLLPNGGDIAEALAASVVYGSCLVEPFVLGREMTVGVLQLGDELLVHPVIEIHTPENTWYDYEHRYTAGQSSDPLCSDARSRTTYFLGYEFQ